VERGALFLPPLGDVESDDIGVRFSKIRLGWNPIDRAAAHAARWMDGHARRGSTRTAGPSGKESSVEMFRGP